MFNFQQAPARRVTRLGDIAEVLQTRGRNLDLEREIPGFCIDSRALKQGEVFVAIPGKRVDGHRFVNDALRNGASACLVSTTQGIEDSESCFTVPDTVRALGYLAAAHRRSLPTKIIGLTGSVGKTTTKEILHTLMSFHFQTRKSLGNFNSTIGLPIQLLQLKPEHEWMVAEMGMSTPGEIRDLVAIARPEIGLWLSLEAVHQANFADIEGIARAKAELVEGLSIDGTLIYNKDNPYVHAHSRRFHGKIVTYGILDPYTEYAARLSPYSDWRGSAFELYGASPQPLALYLPLPGKFNVSNALAACATALTAGVPASELAYSLKTVKTTDGRSRLCSFNGNIHLVDDSYNANPHALQNVLRCFALLAPRHYRWIILGDMLELGEEETAIHRRLGTTLSGYGFDRITLIGPLCENAFSRIRELEPEGCKVEHYHDVERALSQMDMTVPVDARIWVKASRAIRLELIVRALAERLNPPERNVDAV